MDSDNTVPEKLDVEDEERRFQRIQSTLERLNQSSSTGIPTLSPSPVKLPTERSQPHSVPPSELLARVRAFLPEIEASNAVLEQRRQNDPNSIDIEHVEESEERYIEMNLGLGLFEQRGSHPRSGEGNKDRSGDVSPESDSDSDLDSESETDSESGSDSSSGSHVSQTNSVHTTKGS